MGARRPDLWPNSVERRVLGSRFTRGRSAPAFTFIPLTLKPCLIPPPSPAARPTPPRPDRALPPAPPRCALQAWADACVCSGALPQALAARPLSATGPALGALFPVPSPEQPPVAPPAHGPPCSPAPPARPPLSAGPTNRP